MNWRVQSALSGILAVLGLFVMFNPVTVVTAATSYIPWLLIFAGGIQYLSILFRSRRVFRVVFVPALIGTLLIYAGLSMKFGDPSTVGPISLVFVLALLLFGSGAAKLFVAASIKKSKYVNFVLGSGILSAVVGLIVLFNWSSVSATFIGVVLGLELLADAVVMAALALRDRDGEEAMEARGLDPVVEAARAVAQEAATKAEAEASVAAATLAVPPVAPAPGPYISTTDAGDTGLGTVPPKPATPTGQPI